MDWVGLGAAGVCALGIVLLALAVVRLRRRLARLEEALGRLTEAPSAAAAHVDEVVLPDPRSFVITTMADPVAEGDSTPATPARIEGRLFADLVARESVVRAGATAAGLRRALSPESRLRIRFTVRQQAKLARKRRRSQERAARRMSPGREVA